MTFTFEKTIRKTADGYAKKSIVKIEAKTPIQAYLIAAKQVLDTDANYVAYDCFAPNVIIQKKGGVVRKFTNHGTAIYTPEYINSYARAIHYNQTA